MQVYDWDFDIFQLAERTQGHPLFAITIALLESEGLLVRDAPRKGTCGHTPLPAPGAPGARQAGRARARAARVMTAICRPPRPAHSPPPQDGWLLDREVVVRYLHAVEGMYKANPYHNNTHAADVTQTAAVIMRSLEAAAAGGLTPLEKLSIILAAAVHDLAHPGVNNDFLIKTRDSQAVVYNDRRCGQAQLPQRPQLALAAARGGGARLAAPPQQHAAAAPAACVCHQINPPPTHTRARARAARGWGTRRSASVD